MQGRNVLEGVPARLWKMVVLAPHRLLMLDYDGTLAPFVADRQAALPLPRTLQLVRRIASQPNTSVAIVSGRPLQEVERLVKPVPAVFVGEHGWERRGPDGSILQQPLRRSVAAAIDEAERIAVARGWGELIERKRSAVVLHTRSLPRDRARALCEQCASAWEGLAQAVQVTVDLIDGGVELRARGRSKGTAVLSLLSQSPFGTLGVFVGDDVTDEDAFDVVRDWGFGIRVGDCSRPSLATGRIPSCEAVPAFLEEWLTVVENGARDAR